MRGHVSDICEPESPKGVFEISMIRYRQGRGRV